MGRLVRVRLVRACELVVAGKFYRLGDVLELGAELAEVYLQTGDVQLLDDVEAAPVDEAPVEAPVEAPAKPKRTRKRTS